MADNSDDEDTLILDEEEQSFLLQDMQTGISEAIVEIVGNGKNEKLMIPETTRYAHQNSSVFTTDSEEIMVFIGITYITGYHVLPTIRSYWSTEPDMGVPYIAQVMPLARFEEIRRNHF